MCAVAFVVAGPAVACGLRVVPGAGMPAGRVAAAELTIRHGAVGAAFLAPDAFDGWLSITPAPGFACVSPPRHVNLTPSLKLYLPVDVRWDSVPAASLHLVD